MIEISKDKMIVECSLCIDYLRKVRRLNEFECLALLTYMLDSYPKEYVVRYELK